MGVPFLEHPSGERILHCKHCDTPITNSKSITSFDFKGEFGDAVLVNAVVNLELGERLQREMRTGTHWVRPASCKKCAVGLGWYYEYAYVKEQEYKEKHWLLERTRLKSRRTSFPVELGNAGGRASIPAPTAQHATPSAVVQQ